MCEFRLPGFWLRRAWEPDLQLKCHQRPKYLFFDSECPSSITSEQQVHLWRRVANLDASKCGAALILRKEIVARQVCLSTGGDFVANTDGANRILSILEDYVAPAAVDSVYQEVARFLQSAQKNEKTDVYLVEFDSLRRKAESKMQMGGGLPKPLVSILCMQDVAPPRRE